MKLENTLAETALARHPIRSALALEKLGEEASVSLLAHCDVEGASRVMQHVSPTFAGNVLSRLEPQRIAELVEQTTVDVGARWLRRLEPNLQETVLGQTSRGQARNIRLLLGFPPGSAGSLMDPSVLALPQDLAAREAIARIREAANQTRYNVYVVDENQQLVGVLNLRELLLAPPKQVIGDAMTRNPHRIPAEADREAVIGHPGWREAHALPVVGRAGEYLGAIRYRTLRALESERRAKRGRDADTGAAFGEVISAAAAGVLDAIGGHDAASEVDPDAR